MQNAHERVRNGTCLLSGVCLTGKSSALHGSGQSWCLSKDQRLDQASHTNTSTKTHDDKMRLLGSCAHENMIKCCPSGVWMSYNTSNMMLMNPHTHKSHMTRRTYTHTAHTHTHNTKTCASARKYHCVQSLTQLYISLTTSYT